MACRARPIHPVQTACPPRDPGVTRVIAIVPAYEEGPRVAAVVAAARRHLETVVVVDDGSTDDTAVRAGEAGAKVLRQVPNAGKGVALRAGMRYAMEAGADAVITLDADGQHDANEIPAFLQAFATSGAPLVIGRREFSAMPRVRRLSNTVGGLLISAAVGREIPDNQSGYRLIGRGLLPVLLESREDGFAFEVEMIARCIALGKPIVWVPIRTIYAGEPSHIRPVAHLMAFLRATRDARRIVRRRRRKS